MAERYKIYESLSDMERELENSKILSFQIEGSDIAITKSKDKFYAFKDECPHNRVKLSEGICNIYDEVVCPLHNYRFDLKTGFETSSHGLFLKTYHIEICDDGVYLTF